MHMYAFANNQIRASETFFGWSRAISFWDYFSGSDFFEKNNWRKLSNPNIWVTFLTDPVQVKFGADFSNSDFLKKRIARNNEIRTFGTFVTAEPVQVSFWIDFLASDHNAKTHWRKWSNPITWDSFLTDSVRRALGLIFWVPTFWKNPLTKIIKSEHLGHFFSGRCAGELLGWIFGFRSLWKNLLTKVIKSDHLGYIFGRSCAGEFLTWLSGLDWLGEKQKNILKN